jgi:hypothetical protein
MFFNPSRTLKLNESLDSGIPLLYRYLLQSARNGRLDLAAAIFEQVNAAPPNEQLITDHEHLITIALACVYAVPQTDQKYLSLISNIWQGLPPRGKDANTRMTLLQDRIDLLESHLTAAEILTRHGIGRPLSFFLQLPPPQSFPSSSGESFTVVPIGVTLPRLGPATNGDETKVGSTTAIIRGAPLRSIDDECRDLLKSISRKVHHFMMTAIIMALLTFG